MQGWARVIHSINPKTPTPQNQPQEGRKRENTRKYNERACRLGQQDGIGSALKTSSNTAVSLNKKLCSLHRDAETGTKVLLNLEVLQRGGSGE